MCIEKKKHLSKYSTIFFLNINLNQANPACEKYKLLLITVTDLEKYYRCLVFDNIEQYPN